MKSNENTVNDYTFARLGHQKSADVPFKGHQKSCLQAKHFYDQMTEHMKKVIQNAVQRGTQNPSEIIENLPWDLPRSLRVHLRPTSLQNGIKMLPKELQMIPK